MRALLALALLAFCGHVWAADLLGASKEIDAWLIATRREFHQYPELMWEETSTGQRITRVLDELGIEYM
jgi:metal-dependent amidase/aminoacylase/carboxypeptidase family protein